MEETVGVDVVMGLGVSREVRSAHYGCFSEVPRFWGGRADGGLGIGRWSGNFEHFFFLPEDLLSASECGTGLMSCQNWIHRMARALQIIVLATKFNGTTAHELLDVLPIATDRDIESCVTSR